MAKELLETRASRRRGRVPIVIFGALPATFFCWYAILAIRAGASLNSPDEYLPFAFGIGGIYGTVALWRVSFGCKTRFDKAGLFVGFVAMLPMFLLNRNNLTGAAAASPMIVALVWLLVNNAGRKSDDYLATNPRRLFRRGRSGRGLSRNRW